MKKVLIIGASGSLAEIVIKELGNINDNELTLFARNKSRISNPGDHNIIEGNALNIKDIQVAIKGQDIVYGNLAGDLAAMAGNIVKAMKENGVQKLIFISSIGIYEEPMNPVLKPYRQAADIIESSNLDYTIIRPAWFTNADEVDYELTEKGEKESGSVISRKSIAHLIKDIMEKPEKYKNKNLSIYKPE